MNPDAARNTCDAAEEATGAGGAVAYSAVAYT